MLRRFITHMGASPFLLAAGLLLVAGGADVARADHASFKDEIMPILKKHCVECHIPGGEGFEASGLDMHTYQGVMNGTRFGPIVVPGDAFSSNLSALIEGRARPEIKMPHGKEGLNNWEKHMIRTWINKGASDN